MGVINFEYLASDMKVHSNLWGYMIFLLGY